MHRFHLPPAACVGDLLALRGAEASHALRVLRLTTGDDVTLLDGAGTELRCQIVTTSRSSLELEVIDRCTHPRPATEVVLVQAVTKARSMDVILQKATELGVSEIIPVLARRCVPDFSPRDAERKGMKWQTTVVEAMKQCGTPWLPVVHSPQWIEEALRPVQDDPRTLALLGDLSPDTPPAREMFEEQRRSAEWPPSRIVLWIGPEGDFTPAEYEAIRAAGAVSMSFGPRILRSETAAIYGLAIIAHELQDGPPAAG